MKTFALCVLLAACVIGALASSHSESPNTADSPISDWSDLYAFRSYEPGREDYFTILANLYPLQAPFGGPNYFTISDQFFYEIYFDRDGDCVEDYGFRFLFGASMGGVEGSVTVQPSDLDCSTTQTTTITAGQGIKLSINGTNVAIPLKFAAPITAGNNAGLNWFEYYSVDTFVGNRDSTTTNTVTVDGGTDSQFTKPFDYAGTKTFPDYDAYASQYVYDIDFSGGECTAGRMFVGQRSDPFYITLGKIFDLVNMVPIAGLIEENPLNNDLRNSNIHVIALELPIDCFDLDSGTLGIWLGTRKLVHEGTDHVPGAQVSRLGNPLVNELVIGLRDKSTYSHSVPSADGQFADYVTNPTLPAIINLLFLSAVNQQYGESFTDLAPQNLPRTDLVAAFLTGLDGVNQNGGTCDILRLNTSIAATARASQNAFGIIGGDLAGFPNGRRPGDDATDIALRVVMGRLCYTDLGFCTSADAVVGNVDFSDGSPVSARDFGNSFPYLNTPYPGAVSGKPKEGCDSLN